MADVNPKEHLIVSIIVDNSYVAQSQSFSDALSKLVTDIFAFQQSHPSKDRFHLAITTFGGLEPVSLKSFEEDHLNSFECNGFPLMDGAIQKNLKDLNTVIKQLNTQNHELYKPWLIILSSGVSYESLSILSENAALQQLSQTTLFPFLMDDKFLSNHVTSMNRLKPFMVIKDHQIDALFNWLKEMLNQRLKDSSDVKMRLDKEMLKDWIYL